jgi:hypothetical protein
MRKLHFLLGCLAGLIVAIGIQWLRPHSATASGGQPVAAAIHPAVWIVPADNDVPQNWGSPHWINGQKYYVIPLATAVRES